LPDGGVVTKDASGKTEIKPGAAAIGEGMAELQGLPIHVKIKAAAADGARFDKDGKEYSVYFGLRDLYGRRELLLTPQPDNYFKLWESVKKHIESDNENDWRQAIMDADIILDDLLNKMGYRGESVGEKLKRVERGDFATLDLAWEAHKVRNRIAHEGASFSLDHREAKAAYDNYRKVFEEFYYI